MGARVVFPNQFPHLSPHIVRADGTKQWYYELSDATLYSDRWPNMYAADGKGMSLNRKDFTTMGYGYTAWEVKAPTPGK